MGGGYDDCEDTDNNVDENHSCTTTTGSTIYILDGDTGAILKTFPTLRGVVGNVTIVPVSKNNPEIQYAYATDMGGNIYRISGESGGDPAVIGSSAPADWIITRIASLGCATPTTTVAGCDANRKFIFGPDVVKIPGTDLISVLAGSGDREKPLEAYGAAYATQNYFYSIIDKPSDPDWLLDVDTECGGTSIICHAMLTNTTATITGTFADEDQLATIAALGTVHEKGWKLQLEAGEQVVTSALVVADNATFSSHTPITPAAGSCENDLGRALIYNIDYLTAEGEGGQVIGGGLIPSPTAGNVELDDGTIEPFLMHGNPTSPYEATRASTGTSHTQPSGRVYWNIKQ